MKNLSILVAYSKNRVIGAQGAIPWKLPYERNRFKEICSGKKIIMGRKSFEEIGHALPYCTIIIVSRLMEKAPAACLLAGSLEEAIEMAESDQSQGEILIAGGGQIYQQALPYTNKIYATEIQAEYQGDTYFPELDTNLWKVRNTEDHIDSGVKYKYLTFVKA